MQICKMEIYNLNNSLTDWVTILHVFTMFTLYNHLIMFYMQVADSTTLMTK